MSDNQWPSTDASLNSTKPLVEFFVPKSCCCGFSWLGGYGGQKQQLMREVVLCSLLSAKEV